MIIQRLLYRSDNALTGLAEDVNRAIEQIIAGSRRRNEASGITGALMFSSGVFIQVLEGPVGAVEATFERICLDLRHRHVRLLELAIAEERVFAEWAMVQVTPTLQLAPVVPVDRGRRRAARCVDGERRDLGHAHAATDEGRDGTRHDGSGHLTFALLRRLRILDVDEAAGLAPPQRRVVAVLRAAARRACPARRCGRGRARPAGPCARWSRAGARWRSRSCRRISVPRLSWIAASTSQSSAEVASSSTRIGAFFRITRAIAMRWRWPPESFTPRSPTCAS